MGNFEITLDNNMYENMIAKFVLSIKNASETNGIIQLIENFGSFLEPLYGAYVDKYYIKQKKGVLGK